MPDHLHWLLVLGEKRNLSTVVGGVKSLSAHRIGHRIWQTGFHDHALRHEKDLKEVGRYVVANPLRAGLVKNLPRDSASYTINRAGDGAPTGWWFTLLLWERRPAAKSSLAQ